MEVPAMDETMSDVHLTSAAAFVEGGIQEACDDSCSICLEAFCDSDPSAVTSCKHEFHLQCILEWCQRSSQCPMCWRSISLKDPTSQELLEAVEKERNLRLNLSRNATIFHHPALGEFELQHLPVGVSDAELEERIIQHLAAAAAMRRARHIARREGHRNRSSDQSRPQFLAFSPHPNLPPAVPVSSSPAQNEDLELTSAFNEAALSRFPTSVGEESPRTTSAAPAAPANQVSSYGSGAAVLSANQQGTSLRTGSPSHSTTNSQDRAGPSEFPSFSESLKSRLNAVSMKYKESISKSTRGWKERWFSRNTSMSELGSEVRREVNAGIATVSRMMERLETRDFSRMNETSLSAGMADRPTTGSHNQQIPESADGRDGSTTGSHNQQIPGPADGSPLVEGNESASFATGSRSS